MMKKLLVVAVVSVLGACGSKADNALSEFEGFKNRMCDCKDKDCADAVRKDMKEWEKKMREENIKKSDLSDDQKAKRKEIQKELSACRSKFREKADAKMGGGGDKPAEMKK